MKVSILTPNLSDNCLGRAYLLAKILQRHYEVEIVGPIFGDGIWGPVAQDKSIKYISTRDNGRFKVFCQIAQLVKRTTGDVIYASKPVFSSYDVGLLKKCLSNRPLVLDIDDWELGCLLESIEKDRSAKGLSKRRLFVNSLKRLLLWPDGSYWWTFLNERLVKYADHITVSNNFLRDRFGGTIVWHARDTRHFDPGKLDKSNIRERYGIGANKKTVIFCGTLRPHKGVEDLIIALEQIPEVLLIIIGDDKGEYSQKLIFDAKEALGNKRVLTFGVQPFSKIRLFLAMSDIVVIPQRKSSAAVGQLPAKVFDAMALAKPIISTSISDLPFILNGCGWLVKPGQPDELAEAIQYVFDHPEEAKEKGQRAREQCEAKYSYDAMEKVLCGLFKKYE